MTLTTVNAGMLDTQAQYNGFKNRIINGAMVIDQRNAGASVSAVDGAFQLDRFKTVSYDGTSAVTGKFTVQQNAAAVTPPAGFVNYLGVTSSAVTSLAAGAEYTIGQNIEGFNTADLNWGTANAATVTLSFWVRSSLTGTFGGSLRNTNATRAYPFSFTISTANTWEYKTITIAGDTSGTWSTTNGIGVRLVFGLGVGSSGSGTAGAWVGSNINSVTGATSVVGTNGATWFITGVQLEKGSTATSFDYRPIGTELQLCQRYFISYGGTTQYERIAVGVCNTTTTASCMTFLPVPMRTTPTLAHTATWGVYEGSNVYTVTSIVVDHPSPLVFNASYTVAAGLTANRVANVLANNSTAARLQLSAEL